MDRILRVLSLAMAAAAFGLTTPVSLATPADEDGRSLAQPTLSPAAPSAEAPAPILVAPAPVAPAAEAPVLVAPAQASPSATPPLPALPAEAAPIAPEPPAPPPTVVAPAETAPVEMASPLKLTEANSERSEQLEQIARQADRQTRHGFELAGRGAYFAARLEFLGALKLVAEGLDTEQKTDVHGRALGAALTAMKEAEDFLLNGARLEAGGDLSGIIRIHSTPVLKAETANVTAMTALKCYFTYAQEQFSAAAGHEVAGSMALYALGKLHDTMAQKKCNSVAAAEPKAMVFYQASMLSYPKNYMAVNDLGVMLARCGNCTDARTILEHSITLSPQAVTFHNLAVVYGQLGQLELARQADQQAATLQQAEIVRRRMSQGSANTTVQWTDPQTFAQTSTGDPNTPGITLQPRAPAVAAPVATARQVPPATAPEQAARRPSAAERMSWGAPGYQR
jgi:tetratricopeptide (TPR) repeat protein